jgi:RNA polymerase sigma factor (sigma-70 family)
MSALDIALQNPATNLYDTGCYRFFWDTLTSMEPPVRPDPPRDSRFGSSPEPPVDTTFDLLEQAKAGDQEALNRLLARHVPTLRRWATGRLPRWTRDLMDTDDLVQETVWRVAKRLGTFESRHVGALQAYLRQAVMNRIRDEVRRRQRMPMPTDLDENVRDPAASPLETAIGEEAVDRYEAALARLRPEDREAIIARVELDGSYQDVAEALGKPSVDAARMAVSRALLRLAAEMKDSDA